MLLSTGALGFAVLMAVSFSPPGNGVEAQGLTPNHLHLIASVHNRVLTPRPYGIVPVPRRRVHLLDPRGAANLVAQHELRRRRGKRPQGPLGPYPYHRGPPRGPPKGPPKGPPRPPRYSKGPPKRKNNGSPSQQATRGSSPAETRVRYRSKPGRKSKPSKSKSSKSSKSRPPLPSYADGYADEEEILEEVNDRDEDRDPPRKHPTKSTKPSKSSYDKGWGPDGGYRVPAPQYPPYGVDEEEEPGTGHLDLEERFINQHNQFYRHGYPGDQSEEISQRPPSKKTSKSKTKPSHDEEIEVVGSDDLSEGIRTSSSSKRRPTVIYKKPSSKTKYSIDESHHESEIQEEYRPPSKSRTRSKKKGDSRRQNMFHAKFREDERPLSAISFNYELSGAASETSSTSVNNHRPAQTSQSGHGTRDAQPSSHNNHAQAKPSDAHFFRTRKPQYWG